MTAFGIKKNGHGVAAGQPMGKLKQLSILGYHSIYIGRVGAPSDMAGVGRFSLIVFHEPMTYIFVQPFSWLAPPLHM
jgi:hypothetical protein